ncbi:MAG TPA: ATP-binding cassette domain-containing protein, partial [Arachidicoccus sp.]
NDWLKALNVMDLAQKRLANVSSGMQRLFLLIRAFIKNPPLLIFDEPCQGLDELQTQAFVKLVDDICAQTDTSVVYISHYENEVPDAVTQVLELDNGNPETYSFNKKYSEQLIH